VAILLVEGVCQFDEPSYKGGQGDLCGFTGLDHGLVFLLEVWVEAGRHKRGHVECIAQELASALNERAAPRQRALSGPNVTDESSSLNG